MTVPLSFDQRPIKVKWGGGKLLVIYCSVEQVIYSRPPDPDTDGSAYAYATFDDFKTVDPDDDDNEWWFASTHMSTSLDIPDKQQPPGVEAKFNGEVTSTMLGGINTWSYYNPRGDLVDESGGKYYSYDPTVPVEDPYNGGIPEGSYIDTRGGFGVLVLNVGKRIGVIKKDEPSRDTITGTVFLHTISYARIRVFVKPVSGVKLIDVGKITDSGRPRFNTDPDMTEPKVWSNEYVSDFLPNTPNMLHLRTYELEVKLNFKTNTITYDLKDTTND